MNQAMKQRLLRVDKATKNLFKQAESAKDATRDTLQSVAAGQALDAKTAKELSRRKLVAKTKTLKYAVSKGPKFGVKDTRVATLTDEMLRSGEWKTAEFKPYNLEAAGKLPMGGFLHPLMKVRPPPSPDRCGGSRPTVLSDPRSLALWVGTGAHAVP